MKKKQDEREREKKEGIKLASPVGLHLQREEGKRRHGGEFKCLGVSGFTGNLF